MSQGHNKLACPKCQTEDSYLVSVNKGNQFVCCKKCGQLLKAEVKNGQFTGKAEQA